MIRRILGFLTTLTLGVTLMTCGAGAATSNIPVGDIGDGGTWLTEHNVAEINSGMSRDITAFTDGFQSQLVDDFVPIEARVGMAFMNAMTGVGRILDNSLVRFVNIFLIAAYLFWVMFEAYAMMTGKQNARDTVITIAKKGLLISVWIMILRLGPAQLFMLVMGPVISIGTYMSDMILNAVTMSVGTSLPDTCASIREYAATHAAPDMLISAQSAADIMCVPTRMSGFLYTGVAAGWKWMLAGIGHSALTFVIGATFVVLFTYNIWKFALIAFGVIADLFLAIFMLPFTAVAETLGKTSYKGVAGNIFNSFLGIFNAESLQKQISRFIDASLYFVSLSIVVALCAALLSTFVTADLASSVPSITNADFMTTLLSGLLIAYIIGRSNDMVSSFGGKIDTAMGDRVRGDLDTLRRDLVKYYRQIRDKMKK